MRILSTVFFLLFSLCLSAQFDLSGIVKNEDGVALESASVFLRDSEFATITDKDGNWIISNVPSGNYELKVSYLGYTSYLEELSIIDDYEFEIVLNGSPFEIDQIEINATILDTDEPFAHYNMKKEDLEKTNKAQDVPFLLQYTPSAVVTSDAGAGIGYTGIRIRGTDATRINVNINGIPLNDSESQGVFWVDLPDFASSVKTLQIQRGVGTSTNGSGAFGGTISLNTNQFNLKPYAEVNGTIGSFNTSKYSAQIGTGLMNDKFSIDMRFSKINSEGYVDRASSDLSSWFISLGMVGHKSLLRFNAFSGHEETYQSWWGVPIEKLNGDEEGLRKHYNNNVGGIYQTVGDSINLFDSDRRYNYYTEDEEEDNYTQSHYQLIYDKELSDKLTLNATLHYTKGFGFFEQHRNDDELADYGVNPIVKLIDTTQGIRDTLYSADLRRRRWLDNDFFGSVVTLESQVGKANIKGGAALHYYVGDHFGRVIWVEYDEFQRPPRNYYENIGKKLDYNAFTKVNYSFSDKLNLFGDLQFRGINYSVLGDDNDGAQLDIDTSMLFFNPKLGFAYKLGENNSIFASVAVANREPDRNDFVSAHVNQQGIDHERLIDYELGWRKRFNKLNFESNLYYMDYKNQLVLTGELDDVGSSLRTNAAKSYRAGIELVADYSPIEKLNWQVNASFSRNKIESFDAIVYDYTNGFEILSTNFENTDISFSPSVIAGSRLSYKLMEDLEVEWMSKYVSKQYLDNTSDETKVIDAYMTHDFRCSYDLKTKFAKHINFSLLVNNVFNTLYASNGYTYSFIFGETITERFLYPQAGTNFLLSCKIRFE